MKKLLLVLAISLLFVNFAYADRVWIEDKGVVIPIDTDTGDIKSINNSNGTQTWIYDHGYSTDIVHPDGTTTTVWDNND